MLDNLQYLINRIFETDRQVEKIYLDVDGYRERQADIFIKPYIPKILQVKLSGKSITLEPMTASQRRIIHRFVEKENGLRTLTIGEGEKKRIVIFSARQNEKDALSQSKAIHQNRSPHPDHPAKKPVTKTYPKNNNAKSKQHLKQPDNTN